MTKSAIERLRDDPLVQMFARCCKDSGYSMTAVSAAHLAAKAMNRSALEVWLVFGMYNMERIARGEFDGQELNPNPSLEREEI